MGPTTEEARYIKGNNVRISCNELMTDQMQLTNYY